MSRWLPRVLLLALALGVLSGPARAQDDDAARRELAKQLFMQGNEEVAAGRYRSAIPLYEKALSLAPDVAAIHRNLAVVYKKIGRCDKAVPYYDRFLELRPDAPDVDAMKLERDDCRAILEANPNLGQGGGEDGTLNLTCDQDDATVSIDGAVMGRTPIQPLNLKAGSYNITIGKPGFEPFQRRIAIAGGRDIVLNVTLEKERQRGPKKVKDPNLPWKWTTIGAGSALVVTGVVFTVLAELDRAEYEDAGRTPEGWLDISMKRAQSLEDSVNTYRTVSYVMYGLGGAAVIGGVTWLLLDRPKAETKETVTPLSAAPVPGGAVMTFGGTF